MRSPRSLTILGSFIAVSMAASLASAGGITPQPKAGAPLPGLTAAELALFEAGKVLYSTPLTVEQGLGPIFNKSGCFSCHSNPLGGTGAISVTRFGNTDKGVFDPLEQLGGSLHQVATNSNTACAELIPDEEICNTIAIRMTNGSLAYGLVEAIPDKQILANADPNDLDGDGVSGRAHMVEPFEFPGELHVGRFGWKAQVATVLTFSADAAQNEMGLSNRFLDFDNAPNGNMELLAMCDTVSDPEDIQDSEGFDFVDRVTHFQRYLGVPPQTPKSGMTGEVIFNTIGCAKCHVPSFTTSNDRSLETAIRNTTIRPYSDFLLHNMGQLADGIVQGDASGEEIRTPALWDLRVRDPMLHNGLAAGGTFEDRVQLAIQLHGPFGEGASTLVAFNALDSVQKSQLYTFLDSLGRLEFDHDPNGHIQYVDFLEFKACFGQTGITPDMPCAVSDIDQNGTIDLTDFAAFELVYEGANGDCDNDGESDLFELLMGTLTDEDLDGIPDRCATCVGDFNLSGSVDGADLAVLLGAWGTDTFDLNDDNIVNAADLAILLGAWGVCDPG
ncbi:MAG: di-heme oxidoredictase family protein [Phycisphaerae bacterium]|nr:di-heme oxidoredictase family protein [Phycisphaerae bacterium]